jgi:glycosyltransferase involved in cell wall biosynthesis
MRPSISVVIPVFNAGHRLGAALASIDAQHHDGPLEVIVVDDGSTDDTPTAIAALAGRVRAVRQDNAGPAAARNTGLAMATGEIVAFLDADDLWPDDKLAHQLAALEGDPDLDVVLGRISYVGLPGAIIPDIAFEDEARQSLSNVHLGSGLYRRRSFERLGGFDESLRFSEDHDFFLRAREVGLRMRVLDHVTLIYQLHDQNMTRGRKAVEMSLTTVLKRSLDRRRAAHGTAAELPAWRESDDRYRGDAT